MKVTIMLGSCSRSGRTAQAVGALLEGITSEGGECEQVFLPEMTIENCRQCEDNGWGICRSEGRCVIEDDFAALADKIKSADAVGFATPVYFSDLSESMRRTSRHCAGKEGPRGKPAVGICVAGGDGDGAPACIVSLEKVLRPCGFDLVDVIPARRQNLDVKRGVLKHTGKWLVHQ